MAGQDPEISNPASPTSGTGSVPPVTDGQVDAALAAGLESAGAVELGAEDGSAGASPSPGSPLPRSASVATVMDAATPMTLPSFDAPLSGGVQAQAIDLLSDVELNVRIELGRSQMYLEEVLKLGEGSVVELDKLAGDPVDVLVNDRLVARGEVLVLNDNFCVRISEIMPGVGEEEADA